ncbi:hypothetical protein [Thermithiobacillus plumbiphilus]|uniref:Uncharacterized protein n=1 Tax=Thermithiobacillus plumbiphilus TaxID=1729899 RepID=A0ABU9DAV0_9PROT
MIAKILTGIGVLMILAGLVIGFAYAWQTNGWILVPIGFLVLLVAAVAWMQEP